MIRMTWRIILINKIRFLTPIWNPNDIFAHMGAYVIFKGILVENRNFWLNLEISGPEISEVHYVATFGFLTQIWVLSI